MQKITLKNGKTQKRIDRKLLHSRWRIMKQRCSPKFWIKCPTYTDCTYVKEWEVFDNFYNWALSKNWKGKDIDKDILVPNNKIYSPDTCVFVSRRLNKLLTHKQSAKGKLPTGVAFETRAKKFRASIRIRGKKQNLGNFINIDEAQQAYIKAKVTYIRSFYPEITDQRIITGLEKHIILIKQGN